jgi:hypothetical protein
MGGESRTQSGDRELEDSLRTLMFVQSHLDAMETAQRRVLIALLDGRWGTLQKVTAIRTPQKREAGLLDQARSRMVELLRTAAGEHGGVELEA